MIGDTVARAVVELVADGLSLPTSVAFDDEGGGPYVAESGLAFAGAPGDGRVWHLTGDRGRRLLADGLRGPVNGLTSHAGGLYVSEGGHPARISRLEIDGTRRSVAEGLPGPGNYHVNMVVAGPDGRLYFGQGAMTNTGIVGPDGLDVAWLRELEHAHDVPGFDLVLTGVNATSRDPRGDDGAVATTGAFVPFGRATSPGQPVPAGLPATASVLRCDPDGGHLELVAWGLRNPYGLGFLPDGRLLALDQGADDRGSRPVGNAPDLLFEVRDGSWYGWPDFVGGDPITDPAYTPRRGPAPALLIANHDELPAPERPLVRFDPHVAAVRFDVIPSGPYAGWLLVALFGDERPMTAPDGPAAGRQLVLVDVDTARTHPLVDLGLHRPIDVRVDPTGAWIHVLDLGRFEITATGPDVDPRGGALWRFPLTDLPDLIGGDRDRR